MQIAACIQIVGVFFQGQVGIGLPVGKVGIKHLKTGTVHVVNACTSLGQLYDILPVRQGDGLPVGADQTVPGGQHQSTVGQGQGGTQAGLLHTLYLLQAAGGAGSLVKLGGITPEQGKGDHAVHLGEAGQGQGRHLILEVSARAGLAEQQLRRRALLRDPVELQAGLLLRVVEAQVDRSACRRVEQGGRALLGQALRRQPPYSGSPAGLITDHQLIAPVSPAQGIDAALCVGGGEQIFRPSRPGAQDGQAVRPDIPEQQGRAAAQQGQDQHEYSQLFQSRHVPHLRFRRAARRLARPHSKAHQRRKKFFLSSAS